MLLLEAVSLHVASIRALTSAGPRATGPAEAALLAAHVAGYLAVVCWSSRRSRPWCSSWSSRACSACTWAAPSPPTTRACPSWTLPTGADFLRRQVLTSRNVRGGWLTDFALGGLNYQIEHHLFPSMPRPNLRRSQALVRSFCEEQGLPYCQSSLAGSYAQALRHLNAAGLRRCPRAPSLGHRPWGTVPGAPSLGHRPWGTVPGAPSLGHRPWGTVPGAPSLGHRPWGTAARPVRAPKCKKPGPLRIRQISRIPPGSGAVSRPTGRRFPGIWVHVRNYEHGTTGKCHNDDERQRGSGGHGASGRRGGSPASSGPAGPAGAEVAHRLARGQRGQRAPRWLTG